MEKYLSPISQLGHFLVYSIEKSNAQYGECMVIVSIDVEVGSKALGFANRGRNDANVNKRLSEYQVGEIEELSLPLFLEMFNDLEIPVTFAVRGQLTEVKGSVLRFLLESPIKHDIGAHGYYHRQFSGLSRRRGRKGVDYDLSRDEGVWNIAQHFCFSGQQGSPFGSPCQIRL